MVAIDPRERMTVLLHRLTAVPSGDLRAVIGRLSPEERDRLGTLAGEILDDARVGEAPEDSRAPESAGRADR